MWNLSYLHVSMYKFFLTAVHLCMNQFCLLIAVGILIDLLTYRNFKLCWSIFKNLYNYLIQFFIFGVISMYFVMEYMVVSTTYKFVGVILVDFQAGLYVGSNVQVSLSLVSRSINWWKNQCMVNGKNC